MDDITKKFLEYVIQSLEIMNDGVKLLLQNHRPISNTESSLPTDNISVEQVRSLLLSKVQEGKEEKIKELFNIFQVDKLSDLNEQHYKEFFDMAKNM